MNAFQSLINIAPKTYGVYILKNINSQIIYVGKARNIFKRLKNYLNADDLKTKLIVENAFSADFIITTNETEALILESNLIKKHQPRYNILLKDDKAYLYIAIDEKKDFPNLELIRKKNKNKLCIGPYTSGQKLKNLIRLVNKIFPLRKCKDNVFKIAKKPCVYYQIKMCKAPCVNLINKSEYKEILKKVIHVLKGNTKNIIEETKNEMLRASNNLEFENASILRDKINDLLILNEKQNVIFNNQSDIDFITFRTFNDFHLINILILRNGMIIGQNNYSFDINYTAQEITARFLVDYYIKNIIPKRIILNFEITDDIKLFLNTASISLSFSKYEKLKAIIENNISEYSSKLFLDVNKKLANALRLLELYKIECYDMSNTSGSNCVGARATYINGQKIKNLYRTYNIKTDAKSDDLKMMSEVLTRRMKDLDDSLPDLILIDGGKTQINAVKNIIRDKCKIISIAKEKSANKLDKIYDLTNDKITKLNLEDDLVLYLMQIRDETHRFVLNFHRKKRGKTFKTSILDGIKGLSSIKKLNIISSFPNLYELKQVKQVDEAEISKRFKISISVIKAIKDRLV